MLTDDRFAGQRSALASTCDWHTDMADFAGTVRHWMSQRGMSVRGLARAAHYDQGLLSKVLNGHRPYSPYLAARLDDALGAGGEIEAAAWAAPAKPPQRASSRKAPRAVEALRVAMSGGTDGAETMGIVADGLAELVQHYAHAVAVAPSAAVYDELVAVRSFAGMLPARSPARQRQNLAVAGGWLSSLLAVSATDLGDHAAAAVWCSDTERRARDGGCPELLGWAALTRSLIAWYQGDPMRSVLAARKGQADGQPGTAAHARLAAQEMRCAAMVGDIAGMADARRRAADAMSALESSVPASGAYSVPQDSDPPYTATSLLLMGKYREAAEITRRVIETAYSPRSRAPGDQPTAYSRTLLILALAVAGLGEADEAAAAGAKALQAGPVVWPTMVLAGKLNDSLTRTSAGSAHTDGFRASYADAAGRLVLPAPGKQT
jgi:Helix-turn-helix domain